MATPNIVPQIDNDGNLGRHGLRWAGIAAHIVSSPVIKLVKDVTADIEESVQLSVNADGDLVLGTGANAVVAATAADITLLQTAIDLLAGTDAAHPRRASPGHPHRRALRPELHADPVRHGHGNPAMEYPPQGHRVNAPGHA